MVWRRSWGSATSFPSRMRRQRTEKRKKKLKVATKAGISQPARVSSPASTGGAGTFFEQHVDAYWLRRRLVMGRPPLPHHFTGGEGPLQHEHRGWRPGEFLPLGGARICERRE